MKSKVVEQVEEVLKGVRTAEDVAKIERIIRELKGKTLPGAVGGFWEGKKPCWEMCQCPEMIRSECPAPKYQSLPCWEIEGTYCKLDDCGTRGDDTSICQVCRVYKRWGDAQPIQIKLFGKGIDTILRWIRSSVEQKGA
jgi:hypothetical protein